MDNLKPCFLVQTTNLVNVNFFHEVIIILKQYMYIYHVRNISHNLNKLQLTFSKLKLDSI